MAAFFNNLDAVNVLMRRIEFSNELITHALIAACYVGNPSVINVLLHKITDLPHKELLLSCAEGDLAAVISSICELDVDPNIPLVCGLTPLMVASSCGHIELIQALIEAGADINLPNDYGNTALDIVNDYEVDDDNERFYIHQSNQDVIPILEKHGANRMKPVNEFTLWYYCPPNYQPNDDDPSLTDSPNASQGSTKPQKRQSFIWSLLKSIVRNVTPSQRNLKQKKYTRKDSTPRYQRQDKNRTNQAMT
jgi:hypothetical protein